MDGSRAMAQNRWSEDLALLVAAAGEAGRVAMTYFRKDPDVTWKNGGRSPVTEADFAANRVLAERLRPARPHYGWLSEESDDDPARLGHETLFVIDPIDGTRGFIDGLSDWVVSAAVVHAGRPVAGVLYAPAKEETFTAIAGGPAFKNGVVLDPAGASAADAPFRLSGSREMMARLDPAFTATVHRAAHVPSLAYRIAMIADGRLDATLVRPAAHDWDIAAAELILEATGGRLCDDTGAPVAYNRADVSHGFLVAASGGAIERLLRHFSPPVDG